MDLANKSQCCGCGACLDKCDQSAISMSVDGDGFVYPVINEEECVNCGLCRTACPVLNPTNVLRMEKVVYGAVCIDKKVLANSSSGGVFSVLAKAFLHKAGIVVGAAFSEDYKAVNHIMIESEEELQRLRGSKYLQSNTKGIYKMIKLLLDHDRQVLFSGVPCQINGLKQFLQKEYDRLLTVEVVCHGVPSQRMHEDYINYLQKKHRSKLVYFSERHKMHFLVAPYYYYGLFSNKKEYMRSLNTDYLGNLYNRNLIYRPSCYNCFAKTQGSRADLTIGDFWGAEKHSGFKSGDSSIVVVNSFKGKRALEEISQELDLIVIDYRTVAEHNKSIYCSAEKPDEREACIRDYSTQGFLYMLKKHYRISKKERIKLFLESVGMKGQR